MLNQNLELCPSPGGQLLLRLPLWGRELVAPPYLARLLDAFHDGAVPLEVLERYPFQREAARAFLERCVAEGYLYELYEEDAAKDPVLPDRVWPSPTFAATPLYDAASPPPFVVLGVPWDASTTGLPGARFGPQAVRAASQSARYQVDMATLRPAGFFDFAAGRRLLEGIALADAGDVFLSPGESLERAHGRVTRVVAALREAGALPLVIGGDHSITHAVLRGLTATPFCVLHIDAHTDLGEAGVGQRLHHGNVFSVVLEDLPHVKRVVQAGLRGVYGAATHQERPEVVAIGMDALRREGPGLVLERLDDELPCYVSIDIDAVDPAFAPATGTPVPGGLFPHELKGLLRAVGEARQIVGADIVEVGAPRDPSDGTAGIAAEALLTLADAIVEGARRRLAESAAREDRE